MERYGIRQLIICHALGFSVMCTIWNNQMANEWNVCVSGSFIEFAHISPDVKESK